MCPVIRVPSNIYSRLEKHAHGFDTPANVIEKLLNHFEGGNNPVQPEPTGPGRDTTKYMFENREFGKSRLVLAVLRTYVSRNPQTSFKDLLQKFPKKLQGSTGVFSAFAEANEIAERTGHKRHFLKPDEVIQLSDEQIAVCTQWGIENVGDFIQQAQSLGFKIAEKG